MGLVFEPPSDELVWHTVDYADNAEQENPLQVQIHTLSVAEYGAEERNVMGAIPRGGRKKANFMAQAERLRARVLKKRVKAVRNAHERREDGNIHPIRTIEELLACANVPSEVLDDIFEAIKEVSVLGAGELGKSDSPSASSATGTAKPKANGSGGVAVAVASSITKQPVSDQSA